MTEVGLRELRQDASAIIRRVEGGEELTVTVAGRPAARIVPTRTATWRRWDDVQDLFNGVADPDWAADRDLVDGELRDPWGEA